MNKLAKIFPFILALGSGLFLLISDFDELNGLKIFGFSLGFLIIGYSIFIAITEKYIDFKDGLKVKKIKNE